MGKFSVKESHNDPNGGAYGDNIWTCPSCETKNTGERCMVCGRKRPKEKVPPKNLRWYILAAVVGLTVIAIWASGVHVHKWEAATCEQPRICSVCKKTEGSALGHNWSDATCTSPRTCLICGKTTGFTTAHKWIDATYTEAKHCSVCGKTEGSALQYPDPKSDSANPNENLNSQNLPKANVTFPGVDRASIADEGRCGKNVNWILDEAGTLYIHGEGAMFDYDYEKVDGRPTVDTPWDSIRNDILTVWVCDGVTHVGDRSFAYCDNLYEVRLADSVTSIGIRAFQDCNDLDNVTLPDKLVKIEEGLFYHCDNLDQVRLPDSLVSIEQEAFRYCRALYDIDIPKSVMKIGECAFEETKLGYVYINERCKLSRAAFPEDCYISYY